MPETTASVSANNGQEQESESKPGFFHRVFLGTTATGFIGRMTIYLVLVYLLVFGLGLALAWVWPDTYSRFFAYFRNLLEIFLILSGIVIIVSIGILIAQIARFVNLLRSEIKPITEDTKEAVKNVRVTAEFVKKHGIEPIIRIQSFMFGLLRFLVEIIQIARLLQQRERETTQQEGEASEGAENE